MVLKQDKRVCYRLMIVVLLVVFKANTLSDRG